LTCDESNLSIELTSQYPNEDLHERSEIFKDNINELKKFVKEILSALNYLESHQIEEMEVRPEFIFYDKNSSCYILLDNYC